MAVMAMVRSRSDENEKQSFGKKTELYIFSFFSRASTSKEALPGSLLLHPDSRLPSHERDERENKRESFAQTDSSTALLVPPSYYRREVLTPALPPENRGKNNIKSTWEITLFWVSGNAV
jgi:hypothetical protein